MPQVVDYRTNRSKIELPESKFFLLIYLEQLDERTIKRYKELGQKRVRYSDRN